VDTTEIYTDGSSSGNPGPSGWAILVDSEIYSGGLLHATNNEAELYAVYQAVVHASDYTKIICFTDSRVVCGWINMGWAMNNKQIKDLYNLITMTCVAKHIILRCRKVKGHEFNYQNNLVDHAASREAKALKREMSPPLCVA